MKIDIGKVIDYEILKNALIKSAKNIRWKIHIKDEYFKTYDLKTRKKILVYRDTFITLYWKFFPAMRIMIYDNKRLDHFYVIEGIIFGFASKTKIEKFLNILFKNIKNEEKDLIDSLKNLV